MVCTVLQLLIVSILLFLLSVVGLVYATRRIEARWHRQETQARLAAGLLVECSREARKESTRVASSCCYARWASVRNRVWCCPRSKLQELEEQVVFASLRARFIRPPRRAKPRRDKAAKARRDSVDSAFGDVAMAALLQTHTDAVCVDLERDPQARLYRHKSTCAGAGAGAACHAHQCTATV